MRARKLTRPLARAHTHARAHSHLHNYTLSAIKLPLNGVAATTTTVSTEHAAVFTTSVVSGLPTGYKYAATVTSGCYQRTGFSNGADAYGTVACTGDALATSTGLDITINGDSFGYGALTDTPRVVGNVHSCVVATKTTTDFKVIVNGARSVVPSMVVVVLSALMAVVWVVMV